MTEPKKKAAAAKKAGTAKKVGTKSVESPKQARSTKEAVSAKKADPGKKAEPAMRDKAANGPGSRFFRRATDRARRIVNDPDGLRELAERANRFSALQSGQFGAVLDDFRALIRLVVAYARGLYREIPVDRLIVVVGGLIYVVSPIDVIPDFIPVAGFLDDVTVIAFVIKAVREELDAFRRWESGMTD